MGQRIDVRPSVLYKNHKLVFEITGNPSAHYCGFRMRSCTPLPTLTTEALDTLPMHLAYTQALLRT